MNEQSERPPPKRVLISGASGLVGSSLTARLGRLGFHVSRLVRRAPKSTGEIEWHPERGELAPEHIEGLDAIVHLSGESIAGMRWTQAKKARILDSRVSSTRTIASAIQNAQRRPSVVLSASAVGYYGDRGDEILDETSPSGTGFLADVCRAWESEIEPVERLGPRVVRMRIGMVTSARGGAIKTMLPAFQFGLGGPVGSGEQWISWIDLDDLTDAMAFSIKTPAIRGAVNLVAPEPVQSADLARSLGLVLRRPALTPLPKFVVKASMGEMGRELLLASQRVLPRALLDAGFTFGYPTLDASLEHQLKDTEAT